MYALLPAALPRCISTGAGRTITKRTGRYLSPIMRAKRQIRISGRDNRQDPGGRTIRLGVIGFGTVGTGTVKVLLEHQREIDRRLGYRLELKTICSRSIHKRDLSWLGRSVRATTNWKEIIEDPYIDNVGSLVGEIK